MLEPRRLAARGAADRMATTLGRARRRYRRLCAPASTAAVGPKTRIEVVTEGVFTRMILDDPALERRRRRAVRRISRALARRRPRPRLRARRAGGPARRPAHPRHVGDARRRAGGRLLGRRPGDRGAGPQLSRSRPAISAAIRLRRIEDQVADAAIDGAARRAGLDPGIPARSGRDPPRRRAAAASGSAIRHVEIAPLYGAMDRRAQDLRGAARARGPAQDRAGDLDRRNARSPSRACAS